jgi:hypothetical protein
VKAEHKNRKECLMGVGESSKGNPVEVSKAQAVNARSPATKASALARGEPRSKERLELDPLSAVEEGLVPVAVAEGRADGFSA